MSSKVGLAVWAWVVYVHTLVDAARNQAASEPAAKKSNQKTGNIRDQTGRGCGLSIDLGMATGTNHVCCLGSDWNHCGYNRRSSRLWHVWSKWTGRWNSSYCLCVAGWCRRRWHEAIGRRGVLTHFEIYFLLWKIRFSPVETALCVKWRLFHSIVLKFRTNGLYCTTLNITNFDAN